MSDAAADDASEVSTELDRSIGLLGALAIGIGTMIAAGIFVLSGLAVSNVGTVAIVSFVIAALIAALTAAAYAEFSSIYFESGGGYMYVSETFDADWTYIMGWTMIVGYPASAAFYLASFSDWFYRFIYPLIGIPQSVPFWLPGIGVLGLLVYINSQGSEESSQFQIAVTAAKIALLILFLYGGLQAFSADVVVDSFYENIGSFVEIASTGALVFITFIGFSAIATNADEIKDPGNTIPKAIYISMGFVTFLYALVVLVIVIGINDQQFLSFLTGNVNLGDLSPTQYVAANGEVSMAYAAQYYLGNVGFYVIIVGALFSMLSAANATVLAGSRVKLALARRNHLPERFEELHPEHGTPYNAVLLTGGFILTFILIFTVLFGEIPGSAESSFVHSLLGLPLFGVHLGLESVTGVANVLLLGGFAVVNVALIASRRKFPDLDRGFQVPLVPYVPALAVVLNVLLIASLGLRTVVLGLVAEAIGIAFWFAWKGRAPSTDEIERETPTVISQRTPTDRDERIVVPIANPDNVDQLLRTAADIAADRGAEVLAISVVTIPSQTPLSRGEEYIDDEREILRRVVSARADGGTPEADPAVEIDTEDNVGTDTENVHGTLDVHDIEVPISATIRISHRVDTAILNTIEQYDADAVLMGWGARGSRRREIVFGSVVDTIATEADCDVLVERLGPDATGTVDSVLLPTAGGPHTELAAEICRAVCLATDARAEVLSVADGSGADESEARERVTETAERLREVGIDVETTVADGDVVERIVERSAEHDLTLVGSTREGVLQQFVFGAIPEEVAREADDTVLVAKRNVDLPSQLLRSIRQWLR
ncbi:MULTISPECIES: amino acid permease [Halococcus]|uniref:UspA domain-containing protein n=1 Tax=Halococcus salifodinae DSM 8989 TaxID=1227456 RepID=M0N5W2_9EURY|nr:MULTISPECIES: amino acid permease [Halococcus]EMA53322.1 UspA domain-containing protein [Halococcus salifodinae DSM 8989]